MAADIRIRRGPESKIAALYADGKIPAGEPIIGLDTGTLVIGNGSNILSTILPRKDVVFVCTGASTGIQKAEIPFPYKGIIKEAIVSINNSGSSTQDITVAIECYKNNEWVSIYDVIISAGINTATVELPTPFEVPKGSPLRVNIKSAVSGITGLTAIASIQTVL